MIRIFVYGSLRVGLGLHGALEGAPMLAIGRTRPEYTMVSLGGFPGVFVGGTTAITGEIYRVNTRVLEKLDRIEGHPTFYERTTILLDPGCGVSDPVDLYLLPAERYRKHPPVLSGDWCGAAERMARTREHERSLRAWGAEWDEEDEADEDHV